MEAEGEGAERWVKVEGASKYEVSDWGRVRSWWTPTGKRSERPRVLKLTRVGASLRARMVFDDGRRRMIGVHRLVLTAFRGTCPAGCEGCHNDGKWENNRLENLRWDTHRKNVADMVKHKTRLTGERHLQSILLNEDREMIKRLLARGFTRRKVAGFYGVSVNTVAAAKKWKG